MKKTLIIYLATAIFLSLSIPAAAQYQAYQKNSFLKVGMTLYRFDYKEDLSPPLKSEEYGLLPGVYIDYAFKRPSTVYARAYVSYAANDITYDGSNNMGDPVKYNDQDARLFKFEGNIGYTIPLGKNFSLIPYFGYGFQYWERGKNRYIFAFDTSWIEETYKWHYIPVGIKADFDITPAFNVSLSASANFMVHGKMKAGFSYIGYQDTKFILGNRIGAHVEMPVTYKFTNELGIVLTPWYEYSAFGKSDWEFIGYGSSAYEPASKTHRYGANIGLLMNF
ncbi:MAG TPA: hypothetical protein ENN23_08535 [Deltaproteobacteria bacterium]|nr:hypothetical protein [Deltaproteobacteria bacterium]